MLNPSSLLSLHCVWSDETQHKLTNTLILSSLRTVRKMHFKPGPLIDEWGFFLPYFHLTRKGTQTSEIHECRILEWQWISLSFEPFLVPDMKSFVKRTQIYFETNEPGEGRCYLDLFRWFVLSWKIIHVKKARYSRFVTFGLHPHLTIHFLPNPTSSRLTIDLFYREISTPARFPFPICLPTGGANLSPTSRPAGAVSQNWNGVEFSCYLIFIKLGFESNST